MSETSFLSRQQQEFDASLMRSIPLLSDFQMQFFIGKGNPLLKEHLEKLSLVFWREVWRIYYASCWGIYDEFAFVESLRKPEDYDYMILVHKSITADLLYKRMNDPHNLRVKFDKSLLNRSNQTNSLPSNLFCLENRKEENYVCWHKNKLEQHFICEESVLDIHNTLKDQTINLLEMLLWYDFVRAVNIHYSFNISLGNIEITRCVSTLSKSRKEYASIYTADNMMTYEICASPYFGGSNPIERGIFKYWDYIRKIKIA